MQLKDIPDMEARLQRAGVSLGAFCEKAGIETTTWWRWKGGQVSPRMNSWDRACEAFKSLVPDTEGVSQDGAADPERVS